VRKWRKSIRDFNFDIGWNIWSRNRQLFEKEIRVGWASWNCYDSGLRWVCNFNRWPTRRTKEDWVVRLTFLGLYVEWLPSEFYVHSRLSGDDVKDREGNIVPLFPNPIDQPWMLEDAEFEIAPKDSEYDIWVITPKGGKHGLIAKDAVQLSIQGGKGPDRFRKWLMREWVFKEWVDKPNKLIKSIHNQPDDGTRKN